jgi:hypothetical protein
VEYQEAGNRNREREEKKQQVGGSRESEREKEGVSRRRKDDQKEGRMSRGGIRNKDMEVRETARRSNKSRSAEKIGGRNMAVNEETKYGVGGGWGMGGTLI